MTHLKVVAPTEPTALEQFAAALDTLERSLAELRDMQASMLKHALETALVDVTGPGVRDGEYSADWLNS